MRLLQSILILALQHGIEGFLVPTRRRIGCPQLGLRSSIEQDGDAATPALMSMIQKRDAVIQDLQNELDNLESALRQKSDMLAISDKRAEDLKTDVHEKDNMLTKRDQLIENLEEEIVDLENQLKSTGNFKEKKPPMKARKVVGVEDDWVDPLQDVQGSLIFHLGMTIRLTIITFFYRIPKFFVSFAKNLLNKSANS